MAIVIRQIIASDSISQAVDKINFNFDQFLINGGGPEGPQGPPGPIGPIGNTGPVGPQGERGTGWYIGDGDPNLLTFTVAAIDGDLYLDKISGYVWYFDSSVLPDSWINTANSLLGPGNIIFQIDGSDPNINPGLAQYKFRYIQPSADLAIDTSGLSNAQSFLVGGSPLGAPETAGVTPPDDVLDTISDTYAGAIGTSVGSLFVHAPKRVVGSNIVLSRILGDGSTNFNTDDVLHMSTIRVDNYDGMFIESPREITSSLKFTQPRGIYLGATDSDIEINSGRNITIQTSLPLTSYSSGIFGANSGNGIIKFLAPESTSLGYDGSAIRFIKGTGGGGYGHAYISLGSSDPSVQPAPGNGTILLRSTTGDPIDIFSQGSVLLRTGATTRISIDASGNHTYSGSAETRNFTGNFNGIYNGYSITPATFNIAATGAVQLSSSSSSLSLLSPFSSRINLGTSNPNGTVTPGRVYITKYPNPATITIIEQSGYDLTFKSVSGFSGGTTLPEGTRFGRITAQKNLASNSGLANNIDLAGISFEADAGYSLAGLESTRITFSVLRNSAAAGMEERIQINRLGNIVFTWNDSLSTGTSRDALIYPRDATVNNATGANLRLLAGRGGPNNGSSSNGGHIELSGGIGDGFLFSFGGRGNVYLQTPTTGVSQSNGYGLIGIGRSLGSSLLGKIHMSTFEAGFYGEAIQTLYVQEGTQAYPWFKLGSPGGYFGLANNYAVEIRTPGSFSSGYWGDGTFAVKNNAGTVKFGLNWEGEVTKGIQFPATQVSSASANNLDDYEEGNMVASTTGGAPVGVVYVSNGAVATDVTTIGMGSSTYLATTGMRYTKVGNMVHCQFQINANFDILNASYDTWKLFFKLPFVGISSARGQGMWWRNIGVAGSSYSQAYTNRLARGFGKMELLGDIVYVQPMKNEEYVSGVWSADGFYVSELKSEYSSTNTFEFSCSITYQTNT